MCNLKVTVRHIILTFSLLTIFSVVNSQTIEKTFQGWWATTSWTFEFKADGTYKRVSAGHYGNTTVNGTYRLDKDTIYLLTGYKGTHSTVNEKYLLDGDSILIDLILRYDYKLLAKSKRNFYNSQTRQIKYPQTSTTDINKKKELEFVLNLAFNSADIKKYYHFGKLKNRKLIIQNYHYLDANIKVDSLYSIYKSKDKIADKFYVEFEDINQNENSIEIKLKLHDEGVSIWFYYNKVGGQWIAKEPYITEN